MTKVKRNADVPQKVADILNATGAVTDPKRMISLLSTALQCAIMGAATSKQAEDLVAEIFSNMLETMRELNDNPGNGNG